jgi:hypothetical protein
MSHITDKAIAGSVSTSAVPTTFRTHPHRTHPESSRQCGRKGSGKPQQPGPPSGDLLIFVVQFLCADDENIAARVSPV